MRCSSCDEILSDFEATRKHRVTKKFLDLCNMCYSDSVAPPPVIVRHDLAHDSDDYMYDEQGNLDAIEADIRLKYENKGIDND